MRVGLKCTNSRENSIYLSRLIWRIMALGKSDSGWAAQFIEIINISNIMVSQKGKKRFYHV